MRRHTYLSFPDDFRDQLITQRTGFVPFPHQVTHSVCKNLLVRKCTKLNP